MGMKHTHQNRTYLGDFVYIEYNAYEIRFCTNYGKEDTNIIYLNKEVTSKLLSYFMENNIV